MKDIFDRESEQAFQLRMLELLRLKEKNKILYPETNKKNVEEQLSEMFEDDRPKSME